MTERTANLPAIIPFLVGDLLLLAAAGGIVYQSPGPLSTGQTALCVAAVALGAWLLVTPFILKYRAELKLAEADALSSTVAQLQNLLQIKNQIAEATDQWQVIQAECARTVNAAKDVTDALSTRAREYAEFLQKTDDSEKATLRLEVDKLRRAEADWLQVLVLLLDHVYALYRAGVLSGQANLIQQLSNFQNACRDVARRVGLVPFEAAPGEPFNPEIQQLADPAAPVAAGTPIAQTLVTGCNYRGRLLRPALVVVQPDTPLASADPAAQEQEATSTDSPTPAAGGPSEGELS